MLHHHLLDYGAEALYTVRHREDGGLPFLKYLVPLP